MKKYFLMALICLSTGVFAQTPADLVKQFFTTYKTDPGKAILDIHQTNKWNEKNMEAIVNKKNLIETFKTVMGNYNGEEFLSTEKLAPSLEKYVYLVKYDQHPLIFGFVFYKPADKWVLYSFDIDSSIIEGNKEK
jgi:hypothetical protein